MSEFPSPYEQPVPPESPTPPVPPEYDSRIDQQPENGQKPNEKIAKLEQDVNELLDSRKKDGAEFPPPPTSRQYGEGVYGDNSYLHESIKYKKEYGGKLTDEEKHYVETVMLRNPEKFDKKVQETEFLRQKTARYKEIKAKLKAGQLITGEEMNLKDNYEKRVKGRTSGKVKKGLAIGAAAAVGVTGTAALGKVISDGFAESEARHQKLEKIEAAERAKNANLTPAEVVAKAEEYEGKYLGVSGYMDDIDTKEGLIAGIPRQDFEAMLYQDSSKKGTPLRIVCDEYTGNFPEHIKSEQVKVSGILMHKDSGYMLVMTGEMLGEVIEK